MRALFFFFLFFLLYCIFYYYDRSIVVRTWELTHFGGVAHCGVYVNRSAIKQKERTKERYALMTFKAKQIERKKEWNTKRRRIQIHIASDLFNAFAIKCRIHMVDLELRDEENRTDSSISSRRRRRRRKKEKATATTTNDKNVFPRYRKQNKWKSKQWTTI